MALMVVTLAVVILVTMVMIVMVVIVVMTMSAFQQPRHMLGNLLGIPVVLDQ